MSKKFNIFAQPTHFVPLVTSEGSAAPLARGCPDIIRFASALASKIDDENIDDKNFKAKLYERVCEEAVVVVEGTAVQPVVCDGCELECIGYVCRPTNARKDVVFNVITQNGVLVKGEGEVDQYERYRFLESIELSIRRLRG